ncbi:hypothetical protein DACRYDRAFT_14893 [Dacryopinax primogenitus]|uniref:Uncharacterized protein n=1 Tax=Dacryopinax primogenitus (strain DJM 731) TaxID=1858805 RepID=M5GF78_DACPD|nr:uncharacterized protein DACRYDRAFT_14893 [Dacryopinax primogenitus]EJU03923.1 hypothetical protein DACRYDRAFT_14893 [Dacryopinax primogenitus]
MDWFNLNQSTELESHSSSPLSVCIANLLPELRFRVKNLCLFGILPGPKEPNAEQLQRFLQLLVDDLLVLWRDGIVVHTPGHPGGFTDQRSTDHPCTQCHVKHTDMLKHGWQTGNVPLRDGVHHKRQAACIYQLQQLGANKKTLDAYVQKYGVHWSEFNCLPYFNPVHMGVINPMHTFLQGLTKMLCTFEMPMWFAQLPSQVGYPAGGSLTSDECGKPSVQKWTMIHLDQIPPLLLKADSRAPLQAVSNYLKLACALKIFMQKELWEEELTRASTLYNDFFQEYTEVLKMFKNNSHKGGVVKVTFAWEFKQEMSLARINSILAEQQQDCLASWLAKKLEEQSRDVA